MVTIVTREGKGSPLENAELDGNFVALAQAIATKLEASGYTAQDVLSKLKTVAGADSGLDADLLDGKQLVEIIQAIDASVDQKIAASTGELASTLDMLRMNALTGETIFPIV